MYGPWVIDTKAQTATRDLLGGKLVVYRRASDGKPEAQWVGPTPSSEEWDAKLLEANPKATPLNLKASTPEMTVYLHFLPTIVDAMDYAPEAIHSHLRQAYPHTPLPSMATLRAEHLVKRDAARQPVKTDAGKQVIPHPPEPF